MRRMLDAMTDTLASVQDETRIWVRHLIGEGHATVRRNCQAALAELAALKPRGTRYRRATVPVSISRTSRRGPSVRMASTPSATMSQ